LLAKLASLTTTRHSRDSTPGKQSEKTLRSASFSGDHATRKAKRRTASGYFSQGTSHKVHPRKGLGKERMGKERKGMDGKGINRDPQKPIAHPH